jgi:hypothetical protein
MKRRILPGHIGRGGRKSPTRTAYAKRVSESCRLTNAPNERTMRRIAYAKAMAAVFRIVSMTGLENEG